MIETRIKVERKHNLCNSDRVNLCDDLYLFLSTHRNRLYPIYPPSEASNLSISTTHLHLSSFYPVSPDLLILPSSLKPFARIVDSTVCINPGPISKNSGSEPSSTSGDSVGSWARIGVECFDKEKLESKDEVEEMEDVNHDCWERTRVEIVRL